LTEISKQEIADKIADMYMDHYERIENRIESFGCIDEVTGNCPDLIKIMEPPTTDYLCFKARNHLMLINRCPMEA